MELWNYGTMELWNYGTMELWNYGTVELWNYGAMELWNCGTMELWMHVRVELSLTVVKTSIEELIIHVCLVQKCLFKYEHFHFNPSLSHSILDNV